MTDLVKQQFYVLDLLIWFEENGVIIQESF